MRQAFERVERLEVPSEKRIHPRATDVIRRRPVALGTSKLACADILLTLDKTDFGRLLGGEFYGLPVLSPGAFLGRERSGGRLSGL